MKRFILSTLFLQVISSLSLSAYTERIYTSSTEFVEVTKEPSPFVLNLWSKLDKCRNEAKQELYRDLIEYTSASKREEISTLLEKGCSEYQAWRESSPLVEQIACLINSSDFVLRLLNDPSSVDAIVCNANDFKILIIQEYTTNAFFKKMIDKIAYGMFGYRNSSTTYNRIDARFSVYLFYELLFTFVARAVNNSR